MCCTKSPSLSFCRWRTSRVRWEVSLLCRYWRESSRTLDWRSSGCSSPAHAPPETGVGYRWMDRELLGVHACGVGVVWSAADDQYHDARTKYRVASQHSARLYSHSTFSPFVRATRRHRIYVAPIISHSVRAFSSMRLTEGSKGSMEGEVGEQVGAIMLSRAASSWDRRLRCH